MLAYKAGDRIYLASRNGRDHSRRFADLAAASAPRWPPWSSKAEAPERGRGFQLGLHHHIGEALPIHL
jgi:hypothetical protein